MKASNPRWQRNILDELIQEFNDKWSNVTPKHPAWKDRVKLEIEKIINYIGFLKNTQNKSWFKLFPEKKYCIDQKIGNRCPGDVHAGKSRRNRGNPEANHRFCVKNQA